MQEVIDKIIKDFRSGDPAKKARAVKLYQNKFDVKDIESVPDRCDQLIPNSLLEFDRSNLKLLSDSISPERISELEDGAQPTPSELELYRARLIRYFGPF